MPPQPASQAPQRHYFPLPLALVLIATGVFFRAWHIQNVPGINGDETWFGLQAERLLAGHGLELRTPTGNILNPFYFLPVLAVHCFVPASVAAARMVALAAGLLALFANYRLCRRTFDPLTARLSTVLLAVLPINIAYSRFGWDPCESVLAGVAVLYASLLLLRPPVNLFRGITIAGVATLAAFIIHPTNIFLWTFPLFALLHLADMRRAPRGCRVVRVLAAMAFALAGILLARDLAYSAACGLRGTQPDVTVLAAPKERPEPIDPPKAVATMGLRLRTPLQFTAYLRLYARLFSGVTIYRYISGAHGPQGASDFEAADAVGLAVLVLIALGAWRASKGNDVATVLMAGWACSLVAFYLLIGPQALLPHLERYSIWMIAPGGLLAAWLTADWALSHPGRAPIAAAGATVVTACMLLGFYTQYFQTFFRHGGVVYGAQSQEPFRTGPVEPKMQAFAFIREHTPPGETALIICSEWWTLKPMQYFAERRQGVQVSVRETALKEGILLPHMREGTLWYVEFPHSQLIGTIRENYRSIGMRLEEYAMPDYAGKPAVIVLHPDPYRNAQGRAGAPGPEGGAPGPPGAMPGGAGGAPGAPGGKPGAPAPDFAP